MWPGITLPAPKSKIISGSVAHQRLIAMNAYDDLPPLSLAALGSPIRTIYSSRKPMRIQSC